MKKKNLPFVGLILILLLSSCNRNIYVFENELNSSIEKFELKKSGLFLYSNKTAKGNLKTRGTYLLRDNVMLLNFAIIEDGLEFLPFNNVKINSKKIGEFNGTKIHLKVFDEFQFFHLPFLNIEIFSKNKQVMQVNLDENGETQFQTLEDIDFIQINMNEQISASFRFKEKGNFALEASLKVLNGSYSMGCGLEGTGPTVELGFIKKDNKIVEIQTLDSFKKTYSLKQ